MITGRGIREVESWIKDGMPVLETPDDNTTGDWRISTGQCFDWHIARASGASGKERFDLTLERAKLARAQANGQNLKNDVSIGKLIPAEVIEQRLMSSIGRCRALLLGIPSASAGQIVLLTKKHPDAAERVVRELLLKMVDAALNELVFDRDEDEETEAA